MDAWIAAICGALVVLNAGLFVVYLRRRRAFRLAGAASGSRAAEQPEPIAAPATDAAAPPGGITVAPDGAVRAISGGASMPPVDEPTALLDCIVVSGAARSDRGTGRDSNEDAVLLASLEVFAVADGMGGHARAEAASNLALQTLKECFEAEAWGNAEIDGMPRRGEELVRAIWMANDAIRRSAGDETMGTTLVAARFSPNKRQVYVANVGDSRCYRIRDGRAERMTVDHVSRDGDGRRALTRAVGCHERLEVDLVVDRTRPGDYYLLCSDGLWTALSEQRIATLVRTSRDLDQTVRHLVAEAVVAGSRDDVSAILLRIDEPTRGA